MECSHRRHLSARLLVTGGYSYVYILSTALSAKASSRKMAKNVTEICTKNMMPTPSYIVEAEAKSIFRFTVIKWVIAPYRERPNQANDKALCFYSKRRPVQTGARDDVKNLPFIASSRTIPADNRLHYRLDGVVIAHRDAGRRKFDGICCH